MAEFLEAVMLICFGLSWPMNAYKAFKAKTAAGSSWQFIALITAGYVAGIAAKFISGNVNWVLVVYFLNVACIAVNWLVYFHNRKLDAHAARVRAAIKNEKQVDRLHKAACAVHRQHQLEQAKAHMLHPTQA